MKLLDAISRVVLIGVLLLWAINQPIGCAEAKPPPVPVPAPDDAGAGLDAARRRDAELRKALDEQAAIVKDIGALVKEIAAKVDADRKPGPIAPSRPDPAPDAAARALGSRYRADVAAAHLAALEAIDNAPEGTGVADLIRRDNATDEAGRKAAWRPVADELRRRFPDPASADPAAVRAFYRELIAGYKGVTP